MRLRSTLPLLVLAACDGATSTPPTPQPLDVGKGDCPSCDARVRCEEEPTRPGISTPLWRSADDPHRYYALPTRWVIEDASATYWLASSLQYFDPDDVAGFERYTFSAHLALQQADADAKVLAVLRAEDRDATLAPLPIASSTLGVLEPTLPDVMIVGRRASWDAASLTADLDLELTREGVEAMTTFFARTDGIGVVSASLSFRCLDSVGRTVRTVHPQAAGPSIVAAFDGVAVDWSAGAVVNAADQIMLVATRILPYGYEQRMPEAALAALLRPLLGYEASWRVADVQRIGRAVSDIVERWAREVIAAGADRARVATDLDGIRHHTRGLAEFKPDIAIYERQ